jgi:hypothetical protein
MGLEYKCLLNQNLFIGRQKNKKVTLKLLFF